MPEQSVPTVIGPRHAPEAASIDVVDPVMSGQLFVQKRVVGS